MLKSIPECMFHSRSLACKKPYGAAPAGEKIEFAAYPRLRQIEKAGGIGILLYPKDYEQFKGFIEHLELGELPVNLYGVYPFLTEWNHIKNN